MATTIEDLTLEAISRRWPRLLAAIRWAGLLSEEQALAVLYCHKSCALDCSGIPEVAELGGNLAAIRAGIRGRRGARAARRQGDRARVRDTGLQAFFAAIAAHYPEAAERLPDEITIDLVLAAGSVVDYVSRSAAMT